MDFSLTNILSICTLATPCGLFGKRELSSKNVYYLFDGITSNLHVGLHLQTKIQAIILCVLLEGSKAVLSVLLVASASYAVYLFFILFLEDVRRCGCWTRVVVQM